VKLRDRPELDRESRIRRSLPVMPIATNRGDAILWSLLAAQRTSRYAEAGRLGRE
jgi:hypothetical protein